MSVWSHLDPNNLQVPVRTSTTSSAWPSWRETTAYHPHIGDTSPKQLSVLSQLFLLVSELRNSNQILFQEMGRVDTGGREDLFIIMRNKQCCSGVNTKEPELG